MGLLHYERWQELEPEMQAFELMTEARKLLAGVNDIAVRDLDRAIMRLHAVARDEEGRKEFEARQRGEDLRPPRIVHTGLSQADVDTAVEAGVQRALAALAAREKQPQQPQFPGQDPFPGQGHGQGEQR